MLDKTNVFEPEETAVLVLVAKCEAELLNGIVIEWLLDLSVREKEDVTVVDAVTEGGSAIVSVVERVALEQVPSLVNDPSLREKVRLVEGVIKALWVKELLFKNAVD